MSLRYTERFSYVALGIQIFPSTTVLKLTLLKQMLAVVLDRLVCTVPYGVHSQAPDEGPVWGQSPSEADTYLDVDSAAGLCIW